MEQLLASTTPVKICLTPIPIVTFSSVVHVAEGAAAAAPMSNLHANHEVRLRIDAKRRFAGRFVGPHCGNSESQSASRHISNAEPMWIWPEPDTASFQKSPSEIKWQTCARYSTKEKL